MNRVHIKIADRGWILERLANEIQRFDRSVTVGVENDPEADIQYYLNYSSYPLVGVVGTQQTQIGFFTHLERDKDAKKRYFDTAREMDVCVCMSERYVCKLKELGCEVRLIKPGVDLNIYKPTLKIGVVGRTYHTKRKGEDLVKDVIDIPGTEFHFTGTGWPGLGQSLSQADLAEFYCKMDYILIPALYEGGPMSAVEALASGKPVIASDVGWMNDLPHIAFENNNSKSLRSVIEKLVQERFTLRESVDNQTWENWATKHIELFDSFSHISVRKKQTTKIEKKLQNVFVVIHGSEKINKGGPTTRFMSLQEHLSSREINTRIIPSIDQLETEDLASESLVHIVNSWPLQTCLSELKLAKTLGVKSVFSPIFLNLTHISVFQDQLVRSLSVFKSGHELESYLHSLVSDIVPWDPACNMLPAEGVPGHYETIKKALHLADGVIYLSEHEKQFLAGIAGSIPQSTIIRNQPNMDKLTGEGSEYFKKVFGIGECILCVGRIEPRKNQAVLAYALRDSALPLVCIGGAPNRDYLNLVKKWAGDNFVYIDRVEDRRLLASAYASAKCFVLPSWSEGAPLAALEARSFNVPMVLSNMSGEYEYFGDSAAYAHPADAIGIRNAVEVRIEEK